MLRFERQDEPGSFAAWAMQAVHPWLCLRQLESAGETKGDGETFAAWMHAYLTADTTPPPMPLRSREYLARPLLNVGSDNLAEQMGWVGDVLAYPMLRLYQRAGTVVEITRHYNDGQVELRATPVAELRLVELISRVARFQRWDARARKPVLTACPPDLARTYLARAGVEWSLPHLDTVIRAPTLRADGSLLDAPGHDAATGLFYDAGAEDVPPSVSDDPDEAEQDAALETLTELIAEFPFVSDVDKSVAVAAILTACIRRSLPAAPMFGFTAPAAGTGKSCLVNVISLIATGRPAAGFSWSEDQAENAKRLDSALLAGSTAIALDNVSAPLGGDRMNQMLTESHATVRPLGASKVVEVSTRAFVTANGNNLQIAADMTRRTLLCRLDAQVERPELRAFKGDPEAMVRAGRGRYVAAALTLLLAYDLADRPAQPKPLGSFEAWSSWVRGAVMWFGLADPADSIEHGRENDPRRAELAAVLGQWNAVIGDRPASSAQIIAAAIPHVEFREALLEVAGAGGAINTGRLGKWLRDHKGKLADGVSIEAGTTIRGTRTWMLAGGSRVGVGPAVANDDLHWLAS